MPNVSYTIPSLLGGVSQQPDSLRRIDQFSQQENINPSIVDSIKKRAGSEFIRNLDNLLGTDAVRIHVFEASNKIKYFVVATPEGSLRIYQVSDGVEIAFTNPGAFAAYLTEPLITDVKNIKFTNIGDTVFFLNTEKDTSFETDLEAAEIESVGNRIFEFETTEEKVKSLGVEIPIEADNWLDTIAYKSGDTVTFFGTVFKSITIFATKNKQPNISPAEWEIVDTSPTVDDLKPFDDLRAYAQGDRVQFQSGIWEALVQISAPKTGKLNEFDPEDWKLLFEDEVVKSPKVTELGNNPPFIIGDIAKVGSIFYKLTDIEIVALPQSQPTKLIWKPSWQKDVKISRIKRSTMPHRLTLVDDSGTFKFTIDEVLWDDLWHDTDSAGLKEDETPSFLPFGTVKKQIQDLTFFRGRFIFASGESIIMSKTDDLFNFFPKNIIGEVLDDDPIDLTVVSPGSAIIKQIVPFNKTLVLLSNEKQFELAAQAILTPTTVSVTETTGYATNNDVKPITVRNSLVFVAEEFSNTRSYEYFFQEALNTSVANEISDNTPTFVPAGVIQIAGSSTSDSYYLLSTDEPKSIFIYNYFWQGNRKVQSSWHKFTFDHISKIIAIFVIDDTLFTLVQYANSTEIGLEKTFVKSLPSQTIGTTKLPVGLDRRKDVSAIDLFESFDLPSNKTTWTLPFSPDAGIVLIDDNGARIDITEITGAIVKAPGDLTARNILFIGHVFESFVELSKQFFRDRNGNPVLEGRLQLRNLELQHANSGFYSIDVTPEGRSEEQFPFEPSIIGQVQIGVPTVETFGSFKAPIQSNGELTIIKLGDVGALNYLPFNLLNITFTGQYNSRRTG